MSEVYPDLFSERMDEMDDRITAAIAASYDGKDGFVKKLQGGILENKVIYAAYDTDDNDNPIINFDEVAFKGTFVCVYDMHWGDTTYYSEPVTNPTWLDLAVIANEAIHVSGDDHHVFFEGAEPREGPNGAELRLYFGS